MKVLCVCLVLLVSPVLGVPTTNRRGLRRVAGTLRETGGYGIIGSKPADITKYPYTVSFKYIPQNLLICAGAIMNKRWIVTSAYGICDVKPKDLSVRIGSSAVDSGGQELNVSFIIMHEKFKIDYLYDVAVVKTSAPIKLNKKAKPVQLAKDTPEAGTKAQVTGFGDTLETSPSSGKLQVANVRLKTKSECQEAYPSAENTSLCADADGAGPCYNDIGDPLVDVNKKQLIGWFLGGDYCNLFGKLDLYCNAAFIRQWVLDRIKLHSNEEEMEGIDDDDFYRAFDEDDEDDE